MSIMVCALVVPAAERHSLDGRELAQQQVLKLGKTRFGLVNVPPVLFKFFDKPEYADAFLKRGSLRIGTLYDFRRIEAHDPLRADAGEGRFDYTHRSAFPELITLENAPPPLRHYIEQSGQPIASHGGTITAQANYPDCYMFCMTMIPSGNDYGAYGIQISDVAGFLAELTRHLARIRQLLKDPHGYAAPCLYGDRVRVPRSIAEYQEVPVAFIKPKEREGDREVRAIWHPKTWPINPFVTRCAKIRPFLSPL